jgi:DNA invertase Pin-like site-specific DNA recombinase
MTDHTAIGPDHLRRAAFVYIRQSSPAQVENNTESTRRQYALVDKALRLGWPSAAVSVVDDDLGLSGAQAAGRSGFAHMATEVAMGRVGIVLCLEVSRLARNNADWYRLLDLCALTRTLIADTDGLYHPGDFNDRLVLGLKGTMSEAELHILRARLDGGIRHKAARGELRRGVPTGFVWGETDGEILFHPDEAVVNAIRTVFERFAETGSARRVWLWFRSNDLLFPLQDTRSLGREVRWVVPTYHAIHGVLIHPCYAGAYTYGRTRFERYIDDQGNMRGRSRRLPRDQWTVLIRDHHPGFIDWETFEANRMRINTNTRPKPHRNEDAADALTDGPSGRAVREGAALLQGLAVCGHCGRRLRTHYSGRNVRQGYHCPGKSIVEGRGQYCLNIGGCQIDAAVADAVLTALEPAGMEAALVAAEHLEAHHDAALNQWRLEVERRRYEASKAERRYHAVDPENRLVARGLEAQWEQRLRELNDAEAEMERRQRQQPRSLNDAERQGLLAARPRFAARVVGADNHRPRPQGVAPHLAGGRDHCRRTGRIPRSPGGPLAQWRHHPLRGRPATFQPTNAANRRRNHRHHPPPGRPSCRRRHRRNSQPPEASHGVGRPLHRRACSKPAPPSWHPLSKGLDRNSRRRASERP